MIERFIEKLHTPKSEARRFNYRRPKVLDHIGVPKGWVVNSRLLSNAVWENIKSYILPIARRRVAGELEGFKRRFGGQKIVLLAIRDTEAWEGWSVRPVLIDDLKKGADQVLKEGFQALNDGNLELADSKRHAYMSISGMTDSK